VLVGPVTNVRGKEGQMEALRQSPNVHFLGGKPVQDLASYVQHFDVGLMCYEVNDYTRYIYPLKLHEYLGAGLPTVSSSIDVLRGFEHVVTIARNDAEWLAAIEAGLAEDDRDGSAVRARQVVAQANDWDVLVEQIARLFEPEAKLAPAAARSSQATAA
jgi:glycosyltransferase involved in cell wall biosynthesis